MLSMAMWNELKVNELIYECVADTTIKPRSWSPLEREVIEDVYMDNDGTVSDVHPSPP
jgi:hypothetical protein